MQWNHLWDCVPVQEWHLHSGEQCISLWGQLDSKHSKCKHWYSKRPSSLVHNFSMSVCIQGFVVHAYANTVDGNNLTHTPVVFIARQREDGIVSWTIPLQPQGFVDATQHFFVVLLPPCMQILDSILPSEPYSVSHISPAATSQPPPLLCRCLQQLNHACQLQHLYRSNWRLWHQVSLSLCIAKSNAIITQSCCRRTGWKFHFLSDWSSSSSGEILCDWFTNVLC